MNDSIVKKLLEKGVVIPDPAGVHISADIDIDRIAPGVVLHPGTRLQGSSTYIMQGAVLAQEGPVTLDDCQLGPGAELKGGYFKRSVFLDKANFGLGAHVREGCLIEEEAGGAHTVGLKQTILMPFVTLGSLINFCDCLMAGGTSRKDHSEVGSSYIHFNFTPNQDKATPSLIGDVPRGVMLRQRPIFLGGQGGLVGPSQIGFGSVIAAGVVYRGDLDDGLLAAGPAKTITRKMPFTPGIYRDIKQKISHNIHYIANIMALRQWYLHVRVLFIDAALHEGALAVLDVALKERMKRMEALAGKMQESIAALQAKGHDEQDMACKRQDEFRRQWPAMQERLLSLKDNKGDESLRDSLLSAFSQRSDYIAAIRSLSPEALEDGTRWLSGLVDKIGTEVLDLVPLSKP